MKKHTIFYTVLAGLCLITGIAHASIVGTGGKTYPIAEKDMLLVIEEAVAKVDPNKLQQDIQDSFKKQLKDFRLKDAVSALPPADKDLTYRVDLSFTVTPELAQALVDVYGRSIYKAGTKVNPLPLMQKQGISYPFKLVIINADRPAERAWFEKQKLNDNPLVKLLITDGKPLELASQFKRPVYQLTQKIRERFQIQKTPSIVWWPAKSPYLAVKMFKVSEYTEEKEQHGQDTTPDAPTIGTGEAIGSTKPATGSGTGNPHPVQQGSTSPIQGTGNTGSPDPQGKAGKLETTNRGEQQEETGAYGFSRSPTTEDEEKDLADTPDTPILEGHTVLDRGGSDVALPLAGQLF